MWRKRLCAPSSVSRRLAWLGAVAAVAGGSASPAVAQSPREANPERPTFATHAYAVAPGYAEFEQGLAARGTGSLREETSWDVNLKVGVSRHLQIGLFRSEEHTSELQSRSDLVCRLLLEKKKT